MLSVLLSKTFPTYINKQINNLFCHINDFRQSEMPEKSDAEEEKPVSRIPHLGVGRSSEVERSIMVRWVVESILHGVDPLSYFSFQPVHQDWCNKGCGMCYPVCGMVHIKEPLLLIDKSSLCGGSRFPFSLSEWSLTICLTPYNRR